MWLHIPTCLLPPEWEGLTSELTGEAAERLAQSATWRSKPRPARYWKRAWRKERYLQRLSGVTCEPSMATRGVEKWLASLEDIPANPLVPLGRGLGFADPRNLWPDIVRIIKECAPWWCFFENVPAHIKRGYLTDVKPELESLGFRVAEQVIQAAHIGASHKRERLFILALANDYAVGRYPDGDAGDGQAAGQEQSLLGRPSNNRDFNAGGALADDHRGDQSGHGYSNTALHLPTTTTPGAHWDGGEGAIAMIRDLIST